MDSLLVGLISAAIVGGVIVLLVLRVPQSRAYRERQLLHLKAHHARLSGIVGELLARANEVDQAVKYIPPESKAELSQELAATCSQLVVLSDVLKSVESLIQENDPSASRDALLRCCRIAEKESRKLRTFRTALRRFEQPQDKLLSANDRCEKSTQSREQPERPRELDAT